MDRIEVVDHKVDAYVTVTADLAMEQAIRHGSVYGEILRYARDVQADLIVMASHKPELKDFLLGPNAAHVVRHADCSVWVVRE